MKKFTTILFSMITTGVLLLVFGISIAYATFIENDYGTTTAKILIYNSWWFECLLALLSVNLIGSLFHYKMITKKKWAMLIFHLAFIIILVGAAVTRYLSYEGSMHIREGKESNTILSSETFITITAQKDGKKVVSQEEVKFSPYTANPFKAKLELDDTTIEIENLLFMPSAKEVLLPSPGGEPIAAIIAVDNHMQPHEFLLKEREIKQVAEYSFGFGKNSESDFKMFVQNNELYIESKDSLTIAENLNAQKLTVPGSTVVKFEPKKVYTQGRFIFALKEFVAEAKTDLRYFRPENGNSFPDAIKTQISIGNKTKELIAYGTNGRIRKQESIKINNIDITVSYGSKLIELPFALYLDDFQLERYPGSNSPSSYASEVILKDKQTEIPYRIYMNNILKHRGYRFFQSSYDQDEKGTILTVSYDAMGTAITYVGYFLMTLGMILGLFSKTSRFQSLIQTSSKIRAQRKKYLSTLLVLILLPVLGSAEQKVTRKDHAEAFSKVLIQAPKGRIEPVSTFSSEVLRKVAKERSWEKESASEVLLGMFLAPEKWKDNNIIYVGNAELRKILGIIDGKYISYKALFYDAAEQDYKLNELIHQAYGKSSKERNKFDKEVMNVDERVNILMQVFEGNYLTVFPIKNNENQQWISLKDQYLLSKEQSVFAHKLINNYKKAVNNHEWDTAITLLSTLNEYQAENAGELIPSSSKINAELAYNNIDIFGKLSKILMFAGLVFLLIQLIEVFNPNKALTRLNSLTIGIVFVFFLLQSAGLGLRWYVAGHAPWSNGYESMLFISWATCLAGLSFARRSPITLALTTILSGLTLMVAGMSWMNPEITNLVPVLKSYWLIVHVAVITSSYGFLGISALIGLLNLILMVCRTSKNQLRINFTIRELSNIIQIALIIGLILLTVGSFLGGVWANESWGRYWGWDPKETWALVTILVYAFITHMHKIPGFKGDYAISTAALLGFSSVLMTYFGVNFYLSGLHSYAQGEAVPIPLGVYLAVFIALSLTVSAFVSERLANKGKMPELED